MVKPLVSIVIPTYNRAAMVCRAVQNVLDQTYINKEVIVVDDGSTDDTLARLAGFGNRIRAIKQSNSGPSAARNRGMELSRGAILAFQDSDDLWMPTKIDRQVAALERAGEGVPCCLCNVNMFFSSGRKTTSFDLAMIRPTFAEALWVNVSETLATRTVLFNQAVAIRKSALHRVGGYNEAFDFMEDHDLAVRLSLQNAKWAIISEPMAEWHGGSPESLTLKAYSSRGRVTARSLEIHEQMLVRLKNDGSQAALQKMLQMEIRRERRFLDITKLRQRNFAASVIGSSLELVERCRSAFYRRSASFPMPRFEPFAASPGYSENVEIACARN